MRQAQIVWAPVQGDPTNGYVSGTVEWWEHYEAWLDYEHLFPRCQSADCIAERGGFSYGELIEHLGHSPRTWVASR